MSVNKFRPHLFVLPEDDADSQLATGFALGLDPIIAQGRIQILRPAGGWNSVLERFARDHVRQMEALPDRFMVLLLDFDNDGRRLAYLKQTIPASVAERVFFVGARGEPEDLKRELGSYETIGLALAQECRHGRTVMWNHELLRHNAGELDRLRQSVRPILFV